MIHIVFTHYVNQGWQTWQREGTNRERINLGLVSKEVSEREAKRNKGGGVGGGLG